MSLLWASCLGGGLGVRGLGLMGAMRTLVNQLPPIKKKPHGLKAERFPGY